LAILENVIGSAHNDTLTGNNVANVLDGGAGIDTMAGGDGSDAYFVRDGGDVVSETNAVLATGGTDTVYSDLSAYTLTANVENGRILSTTVANLTGNTLNNVLYAGAGNNVLDGGSGIDTVSYAYGLAGTSGVTVSLAVRYRAGHRRLRQRHADQHREPDRLGLCGQAHRQHRCQQPRWRSGQRHARWRRRQRHPGGWRRQRHLLVRDGGDVVSETNAVLATGGTDTVYSYLSAYTLTANVENGRISQRRWPPTSPATR
jgi:Ca2+-binding RTX toxin-like protein